MKRTLTTTLILLGLASASCGLNATLRSSTAQHADSRDTLPSVSAAPPSQVATQRALAQSANPPVTISVSQSHGPGVAPLEPRNPDVEKVVAALRRANSGLSRHELRELAETVVNEAEKHQMDPDLVLAVIHVESRGYPRAVSPVGARGLMQIMPKTGEWLAGEHQIEWQGVDSLFDPQLNVKLGVAYLRQLTDRYNSIPTALAAYNWGPGRIDGRIRRGSRLPSVYIDQVMRAYDRGTKAPVQKLARAS